MSITVSALAKELSMDKSNLLKLIDTLNIVKGMVRVPPHNQEMICIRDRDANAIRNHRSEFKYPTVKVNVFYAISLVPELSTNRVKFGVTSNLKSRLLTHRTTSPSAFILKHWEVDPVHELTLISIATNNKDTRHSCEVFTLQDVNKSIGLIDTVVQYINN